MKNYIVHHLHDDTSNCNGYADSCTSYKEYIKLAKKQNMKAIAFSNHGGIYDWIKKKQDCDKASIKYIHGIELYVCTKLENDERGNHIGLYAKNFTGVLELNSLISKSTSKGKLSDNTDRHMYYNPRISFDELLSTSDNIIVTTACLNSLLWHKRNNVDEYIYVERFLKWMSKNSHRCFLEVQYHGCSDQIEYNKMLYAWSKQYNIPLIAGTDTHSSNAYKAECRKILQKSKKSYYGQEDEFDMIWKTYDELVLKFKEQNALPEEVYLEAINNTNKLADMVEDFKLDKTFKYPNLYGDNSLKQWQQAINKKYKYKKDNGIIDDSTGIYIKRIHEEFEAMSKQGMDSFMLFMSELVDYCNENGIPYGFCRGSVGGSVIAYITDITDVDPVKWNTVFSRFCNADRISLADIDIDFAPEDRQKVYEYIIKRFTPQKTAYIAQFGTLKDRGTIETLARGLEYKDLDIVMNIKNEFEEIFAEYSKIIQEEVNLEELEGDASGIDFDYHDIYKNRIRNTLAVDKVDILKERFLKLKSDNKDIFYYFDGIKGTIVSKGNHPAGIIGSPITLPDNLGVFYKDGNEDMPVAQCAMKAVDSVNFVKFDILGLKTVGVMKDVYNYISSHYLKAHEIDWNDDAVWDDMIKSKVGVFQFEGDYAFDLLQRFQPRYINDMSLVNSALRPSGKSYRDRLIAKEFNQNPSQAIDELLKENYGYLVYQEDTIKFLTDICGFSGSLADTTRRAIGKKDIELLNQQLPKILEGYCSKSDKPREIAEQEAKQFLQIIDDSSEYQFGYNHSTGYSMIGYGSTRLKTYYPLEFITAYLNRAENDIDVQNGISLAKEKGIKIQPIKFRKSHNNYCLDKSTNSIYKGLSSVKGFGERNNIAEQLYKLKDKEYKSFIDLLCDIENEASVNRGQLEILIKLDFFKEFGNINKLLKSVEIFNNLYGRKQIKKDQIEQLGLTEEIIRKNGCKETAKQFKDLNIIGMINDVYNSIEDTKISIAEKLKYEFEYFGYCQSTYKCDENCVFIFEEDLTYTPKIKCYHLLTGEIEEIKVYMNVYYSQPTTDNPERKQLLKPFDIICIGKTIDRQRSKKNPNPTCEEDKWLPGEGTEKIMFSWTKIQSINN